jgi:hypothetical protein
MDCNTIQIGFYVTEQVLMSWIRLILNTSCVVWIRFQHINSSTPTTRGVEVKPNPIPNSFQMLVVDINHDGMLSLQNYD